MITTCHVNDTSSARFLEVDAGTYVDKHGIKITRLPWRFADPFGLCQKLRVYKGTLSALQAESPDMIFVHSLQFLDVLQVVRYAHRHPGIRVIVDNHADYVNSANSWISREIVHKILWRYCAWRLVPVVERFYGVTPLRCTFLQEMYHLPPAKTALLVMGADDELLHRRPRDDVRRDVRERLGIDPQQYVLVTGGKIDRPKNIHLLVEAVASLNRNDIVLLLFGTPTDEMRAAMAPFVDHAAIRQLGWLAADEVYDYFLAADLAVFPGTHSTLWEQAAGSGLPCVLKRWHGMEHIDQGGNVRFLETDSVSAIKSTIASIFDTPGVFAGMTAAARHSMRYFSYRDIARRVLESG